MRLEAQDVSAEAGGRRVVDSVSLTLEAGEMVCLIGPNGAGKSTLLRALAGLRPRAGGTVRLDRRTLETIPPRERARLLAYLPQERRIEWRLCVRDVVALGRYPHRRPFSHGGKGDRDAAARAMARAEVAALADRPAAALSGGEKARVLLARALAVEAPVFLADEPAAAMDPYHQLHVMEILRAAADGGAAVLVVLQDLALAARFADRLALMDAGRLAAEGPAETVLRPETLRAVYHVEALRGREDGASWLLPWARTD